MEPYKCGLILQMVLKFQQYTKVNFVKNRWSYDENGLKIKGYKIEGPLYVKCCQQTFNGGFQMDWHIQNVSYRTHEYSRYYSFHI